jgi:hypothetical protein
MLTNRRALSVAAAAAAAFSGLSGCLLADLSSGCGGRSDGH